MKYEKPCIRILNVPSDRLNFEIAEMGTEQAEVVHLINTYNLSLANADLEYREILQNSKFNIVDSKVLQIFLTLRFRKNVFQNRGANLMDTILKNSNCEKTHLFICPSEKNEFLLKAHIEKNYEKIQRVFVVPIFSDSIQTLYQNISQKLPHRSFDYVWVGIGTPKQDFLASQLAANNDGRFILCVGAAFDFIAGTKKEAPKFLQIIGLEWLFRFSQEPRRLFKRYFLKSWGFLFVLFSSRIRLVSQ